MKTLWAAPRRPTFVTREEMPAVFADLLVRMLRTLLGVDVAPAATPAMDGQAPPKKKTPRAKGHVHRGRCGRTCFTGERGPR